KDVTWRYLTLTPSRLAISSRLIPWATKSLISSITSESNRTPSAPKDGPALVIVMATPPEWWSSFGRPCFVGAAVASWLFSLLGITFGGWIGYLIAGFIGACILIAIARAFSGGLQQRTRKPPFRESRGGLSTKKKTHEFIFSNKIPCCVQMRSI